MLRTTALLVAIASAVSADDSYTQAALNDEVKSLPGAENLGNYQDISYFSLVDNVYLNIL